MLAYAEITLGILLFVGGFMRPMTSVLTRLFGTDAVAHGSWLHGFVSTISICGGFFLIGAGVLVFAAPDGPWIYIAPLTFILALATRLRFGGPTPDAQAWRAVFAAIAFSFMLVLVGSMVRFGMGLPALP